MTTDLPDLRELSRIAAEADAARVQAFAARDAAILTWVEHRQTRPVIAAETGLSTQRLQQVLKRLRDRANA